MDSGERIKVYKVTTDAEFDLVFDIRKQVFQEGQNVPEEIDLDGNDHIAHHYIAYFDEEPCGTARWRITPGGRVKLERISVLASHRKKGIGGALILALLAEAPRSFEIFLNAQSDVIALYEKYGFVAEGDPFFEAEIEHRRMVFSEQSAN